MTQRHLVIVGSTAGHSLTFHFLIYISTSGGAEGVNAAGLPGTVYSARAAAMKLLHLLFIVASE